MNPTRLQIEDF